MQVGAQDGQGVLAGEGCNPSILGRNRSGLFSESLADFCVMECRASRDFKDCPVLAGFREPGETRFAFSRRHQTETILAQNDYGQTWTGSRGNGFSNVLIAFCES